MNIAIDGPAGAGKSTIAKSLAKKLGFIYVDTGALYRAVALYLTRKGADTADVKKVAEALPEISLKIQYRNKAQRVYLGGEDVTELLRTPEMSMKASEVSAIPAVREFLLSVQRSLAAENDVIMDGRDIGTVILPDAEVKIFLTASLRERAKRRYHEHKKKGINEDIEKLTAEMEKRDYNDSNRAEAPLIAASDSVTIDSSDMKPQEVIGRIIDIIKERTGNVYGN